MKRIVKKIIPIMMVLSVLFTSSASAATDDGAFSSTDDNRKWYTPIHCQISITRTSASFQGMSWERPGGAAYNWEGELRVANPAGQNYTISDAYSSVTGVAGTLPQLADDGAVDDDDRAFMCADMSGLQANRAYYVILSMSTGAKYNNGITLYFESEYGIYNPIAPSESLPLHYQGFTGRVVTNSQYEMGW